MNHARSFMKDAPELDQLLEICLSTQYEIDPFDFFYIQGLSEQLQLRRGTAGPGEGDHWYGPSICVAGGLDVQAFPNHAAEIRKYVRAVIDAELKASRGESFVFDEDAFLEREHEIKKLGICIDLNGWNALRQQFLTMCENNTPDVYKQVDFKTPVFTNSVLFLPWKERRKCEKNELRALSLRSAHDCQPYTAHLMYGRHVR